MSQLASAQDVFQTGQTARNYNYIQLTYLVNRRKYELPILLNAQISINQNFTLLGEFVSFDETNQETASNGVLLDFKGKDTIARAGLGFHLASKRWSRIDWFSELLFEQYKSNVTVVGTVVAIPPATQNVTSTQSRKTDSKSIVARLGVRGSITPVFEVQAAVSTAYTDEDFYAEQLNITAVFSVTSQIDVAISALDATDNPNYNFGFRYNW